MRDTVREAFAATPRTWFLPADVRASAAIDAPLPIGHGQTNSQPSTVAAMLTLLETFPGMRALDVGSGSGWTAAILGDLGGPESTIHAVELVPELVERSRAALTQPWVRVHHAEPGVLGLPEFGPFDRILVSAMADDIPSPLIDQLADGGVLVAPWRDVMHRVRRSDGAVEVSEHGGYRFVPLRDTRF